MRTPCQAVFGEGRGETRFFVTSVSTPTWPDGVTVEVFYPARGRLPDGAPVVVVLDGGFLGQNVPVSDVNALLGPDVGLIHVVVDFQGGELPFSTPGSADYRGPNARKAVSAALSYAAGETTDALGCTLAERVEVPTSALPPVVYGVSNGGNVGLCTLADAELPVPEVGGLVTFETPAGAQFVTVEMGTSEDPNPLYEGHCAWSAVEGLVCDLDYSQVSWGDNLEHDGHRGAAYFDLDADGRYGDADFPVWGLRPTEGTTERVVYSPSLTDALGIVEDPALYTVEESVDFWKNRDASICLDKAVGKDLPLIAVGTSVDHGSGAEDHAHVSGLVSAWLEAGVGWARVNPDAAYVEQVVGYGSAFADNPANQPLVPGDPEFLMEPDEAVMDFLSVRYSLAAQVEIVDRLWNDDWSNDLDAPLDRAP